MSSEYPSSVPERRPSPFNSLDGNDLLVNAPIGIFASTPAGRFIAANPALVKLYGYRSAEDLIDSITDIATQLYVDPADRLLFMQLIAEGGEITNHECRFRRRDGTVFWASRSARAVRDGKGKITHYQGFTTDITEQKQVEAALSQHRAELQAIYDHALVMFCVLDDQRRVLYANPAFTAFTGVSEEKLINGRACGVFGCVNAISSPDGCGLGRVCSDCALLRALEATLLSGTAHHNIETRFTLCRGDHRKDFTLLGSTALILGSDRDTLLLSLIDISDRVALEDQLRQAQKMESVGRLAGGVAHDFNNMLGVILGHTEMALEDVDPVAPLYASLQAIQHAAERSADLTRQLLAFARKQTVAPRVIDINDTVEGMLKMLRRLIGEDIDLLWQPGRKLKPVKVDPSQIDQLLVNLCVNARDAIAGQGKITIETDSKTLDEAYCADHLGFLPGEYLLLEVSDDGCGMDQSILSQIFEPFFTTKEQGKGTGLGLASVFGIVKQNNGFINVYSEPGQGTTFKIYLPAYAEKSAGVVEKAPNLPAERGHETVLLVEDESAILEMTTMMLERLGYTVVAAATPGEAIHLAREYWGRIDLLMTDVVMPEMNGRELAGNLLSHYPELKRLFMSGYTANVIAHQGVLDKGVNFIQKPFSMKDLGGKLREALEG